MLLLSEGEDAKREAVRNERRMAAAQQAAEALGVAELIACSLPDQRLDAIPFIEVIDPIESALRRLRPEVVYTHHGGDANTDHQVTFKATYAACRPMSALGSSVRRLLAFETPSSTEQAPPVGDYIFGPNSFVDVEPSWARKLKALECYGAELAGGVHPRSFEYVEALARMRGGYAGVRLAEAFVLVRERMVA